MNLLEKNLFSDLLNIWNLNKADLCSPWAPRRNDMLLEEINEFPHESWIETKRLERAQHAGTECFNRKNPQFLWTLFRVSRKKTKYKSRPVLNLRRGICRYWLKDHERIHRSDNYLRAWYGWANTHYSINLEEERFDEERKTHLLDSLNFQHCTLRKISMIIFSNGNSCKIVNVGLKYLALWNLMPWEQLQCKKR